MSAPAPLTGNDTYASPNDMSKHHGEVQREDTIVGDANDTGSVNEDGTAKSKAANLLTSTAPKDGDLGGRWLATYTGPRPELTDELNTKVRNKIDGWLLPLIFLIYFSECVQQDGGRGNSY